MANPSTGCRSLLGCLVFGLMALAIAPCPVLSQSGFIERLDGSRLSFAEVDELVSDVMREAHVTGMQIAVLNDSRPKYVQSYGFRDPAKTVSVNNDTVFQAASFSKSMFATLVMKLVEEGRFDLDKPVHEYLEFPLYELENFRFDYLDLKDDERHKKITGRMLLAHTAGFRNYRFMGDDNNRLLIHFEPGTQFHYSGEGIILLQSIVEIATGESLVALSEQYLFEPLDMRRTGYVWDDAFADNVTVGFNRAEEAYELRTTTTASAAYSAVTTVTDFAKLLTAILGSTLLRDDLKAAMIAPQHRILTKTQFGPAAFVIEDGNTHDDIELAYGLGWGVLKSPYGYAFIKEGNDDGFQHYSIVFENGTGLVIMTNSDNGDSTFQYLNERVIGNSFTPWDWEMILPYDEKQSIADEVALALRNYHNVFSNASPSTMADQIYGVPLVSVSATGETTTWRTRAEVIAMLSSLTTNLREQGWVRSAMPNPQICVFGRDAGIAVGEFVRYREDGSEISRIGMSYVFEKRDGEWKMTAFVAQAEGQSSPCA